MTTVFPASAAEAVAEGAQLLDEHSPGWWRELSLRTLDLEDCDLCVCGQLARTKYVKTGLGEAYPYNWLLGELEIPDQRAWEYGFDLNGNYSYSHVTWNWAELEAEWTQVIKARLAADALNQRKENENDAPVHRVRV